MENFLPRLHEYAQKKRANLQYEVVGCDGPDHVKT